MHVKEKYVLENWDKAKNKIEATTDYSIIKENNIIIIAVSTPLKVFRKELVDSLLNNKPIDYFIDFSLLERVVEGLKKYLQTGTYINSLVTIYSNGTYERIIKPLEEAGFKLGRDFFVTHTPERLDPGNQRYNLENIPRGLGIR
jgi:UDP-N-acetyl-D-mannosaminuronate dehydrogenase